MGPPLVYTTSLWLRNYHYTNMWRRYILIYVGLARNEWCHLFSYFKVSEEMRKQQMEYIIKPFPTVHFVFYFKI